MKTSSLCGSLLLAYLLLSGHPASAQSESVDSAESPEFQALYGKAREESNKGNLKEAVRMYKAAYELRPNPVLLYNIARLLQKLTRFQEACIYYQLFLDSPVEDSEQKRKAREYLEALREKPVTKRAVPSPTNPVDEKSSVPDTTASSTSPTNPGAARPADGDPSVVVPSSKPASNGLVTTRSDSESTPLYRKWWLWTIVGGVVVAGAVGLGVGLSSTKPGGLSGPSVPADAFHYSPTF